MLFFSPLVTKRGYVQLHKGFYSHPDSGTIYGFLFACHLNVPFFQENNVYVGWDKISPFFLIIMVHRSIMFVICRASNMKPFVSNFSSFLLILICKPSHGESNKIKWRFVLSSHFEALFSPCDYSKVLRCPLGYPFRIEQEGDWLSFPISSTTSQRRRTDLCLHNTAHVFSQQPQRKRSLEQEMPTYFRYAARIYLYTGWINTLASMYLCMAKLLSVRMDGGYFSRGSGDNSFLFPRHNTCDDHVMERVDFIGLWTWWTNSYCITSHPITLVITFLSWSPVMDHITLFLPHLSLSHH